MNNFIFELIDVRKLKPHEHVDPLNVKSVYDSIVRTGAWLEPIIIDRETNTIMDGHHRYEAARKLNLDKIPCYTACYSSNDISIVSWKTGEAINHIDILEAAESGKLLPIKSTRHLICTHLPSSKLNLDSLI
ncbi:ParB N-terminal domain-containing protein [Vibrio sp. S9_S30]|uniref:ParB N-terminal domain-containing protein n=1 Tax=Vibrio sp. S9_S30 TaxID=2720226 RepID=UPI001680028C|nr:ParB N-terminal domain-containing protein [Vibrio sp. S9_S30]MBD1559762.1 ParB N-terminal domain-containing protein [Vibrio sp. S9_S30]